MKGEVLTKQVDQFVMRSNKYTHLFNSYNTEKVYKVVSEKRRIIDNFTVPFDFKF